MSHRMSNSYTLCPYKNVWVRYYPKLLPCSFLLNYSQVYFPVKDLFSHIWFFSASITKLDHNILETILFAFEDFDLKLDTEVIGRNFLYFDEVESTNDILTDPANNLNTDGTVVFAERQLNGKGRKDRKWYSAKEQNLTFSILLKRKFDEKKLNIINLGTSLAIALSLENLYQLKINLKWPNDLLVNNEKISGILLESITRGSKIEKLVIGIGINVNQTIFQGKFQIPPSSIKKITNQEINRERLLSEVLNNFEAMLERVETEPDQVLSDWKSRCRMLGEKVVIQDDNINLAGTFDDVDEEGFLILKTGQNKFERIHFGDVSLR